MSPIRGGESHLFGRLFVARKGINCRDPGSNQGPSDLQSDALPTELSRRQHSNAHKQIHTPTHMQQTTHNATTTYQHATHTYTSDTKRHQATPSDTPPPQIDPK